MPRKDPRISVQKADVLSFPCNVLVLKYAQAWYGADLDVATTLDLERGWSLGGDFVAPGQFRFVESEHRIAADLVLFEGVPQLRAINYAKIREFSRSSILHVHQFLPDARHLAMTIHGVNLGMDERECFLSQLAGVLSALEDDSILTRLEEISFVEKNAQRAERLSKILKDNYLPRQRAQSEQQMKGPVAAAGVAELEKPHVFVAMPFSEEMVDVFIFGVQIPVQEAGFLCERVDMAVFTGDVLERIKSRIDTARLVIADLTGANANVYLEVGYAWGKKVPTLLICRQLDDLRFDVKGQRCLIYASIHDLQKKLASELKILTR
jgi:hypothetical protein